MFIGMLMLAAGAVSNPLALPPFTFAGRVTDYAHVSYDADQKVEIRVYAGDTLVAKSHTATGGNTGYNFAVDVPIASEPAAGCVTVGTKVRIEFVDPDGKTFAGLVAEGDSTVGKPGELKRLTVILATDDDHDGVADEYVESLAYLMWKKKITAYDAMADWDGDGVNNHDEYIAGTNPFDEKDLFAVRQMAAEEGKEDYVKLTFLVSQGRSYTVDTATELGKEGWRETTFADESGQTQSRLNTGGTETGYKTIYLLKENVKRQFWKLKVE